MDTKAEVGARVREIRKARRLSLSTLGARAGVSASFLSQLERGLCSASFSTFRNISNALGIPLAELISDRTSITGRVVRADSRPQILQGPARKYLLSLPPLDAIEIFLGQFDPGASTGPEPYNHGDSQEFLMVLKGTVELEIDSVSYTLSEGDISEYRSSQLHRLSNVADVVAEVLWIVSPVTVSNDELQEI